MKTFSVLDKKATTRVNEKSNNKEDKNARTRVRAYFTTLVAYF